MGLRPNGRNRHPERGLDALAGCATWEGAQRVADWLVTGGRRGSSGVENADFWYAAAAKLLAPLLFAATHWGGTMADVLLPLGWPLIGQGGEQLLAQLVSPDLGDGDRDGLRHASQRAWDMDDLALVDELVDDDEIVADQVGRPAGDGGAGDARVGLRADRSTLREVRAALVVLCFATARTGVASACCLPVRLRRGHALGGVSGLRRGCCRPRRLLRRRVHLADRLDDDHALRWRVTKL